MRREFPGSPVFRTLLSLLRAPVGELRSHKPQAVWPGQQKKRKKRMRRAWGKVDETKWTVSCLSLRPGIWTYEGVMIFK